MTWVQRYRVWHYMANAIRIWPLLSMGAALGAFHVLHALEEVSGLVSLARRSSWASPPRGSRLRSTTRPRRSLLWIKFITFCARWADCIWMVLLALGWAGCRPAKR